MPFSKKISWPLVASAYLAVGLLTVTFAGIFANILFSEEAYYPAIDQRNYFALVHVAHDLLVGAPHSWLPFRESLPSQYNALFALPLAPAFAVFGESYYVYGMSVALIYATLGTLAVAGAAAFVLADQGRGVVLTAFAATALCAITRSAGWFSTRNYYPDIGDALVLALWLVLTIALLRQPSPWRMLAVIAASLCVILFRRHLLFAWGASGIGLAICAMAACAADRSFGRDLEPSQRLRTCMTRVALLAASAIVAIGIVCLLIPSYAREMASVSGADAYRDFERNPLDVMAIMAGVMGIVPLALSAAGYVAAALTFPMRRFEIIGVGLAGVLHLLLWSFFLRQAGWQHLVVPGVIYLPIGIGLGAAVLANLTRAWQRTAALTTAAVLLCMSAGRLVHGATEQLPDPLSPRFWQARVAPLVVHRGMKTPFLQVFSRIGHPAGSAKIFVVASSPTLNEGIAQSAAETLLGTQASAYSFLWVPATDVRDRLPLSELLQADYVLVVRPPQTVLHNGFDGLNRVLEMFANHDPAAGDFEQLGDPIAFPTLSVTVYRRTRPSSLPIALAAFEELRAAVPRRGFTQPAWVEIGQPSESGKIEYWGEDAVIAHDRSHRQGWPARFLSYDLVSSPVELTGDVQTTCPGGTILRLAAAAHGQEAPVILATSRLGGDAKPNGFLLNATTPEAATHLVLEIDAPDSIAPCDVTLRHVQLKSGHWLSASGGS